MSALQANDRRERLLGFLAQDPSNCHLIAELVDLELAIGLPNEAEAHLRQGLATAPDDPQLLFQRATLALHSGAVDESEHILRRLHEDLGIDAAGIRYTFAYTLMLKNQYAEVRALLEPILDNPDTPDAVSLMVRCLHFLGELEEAISLAEKYLLDHPNDAMLMGSLAVLYTDMEDMDKASEWSQRALEIDPDNANARLTLGTVSLANEDTEQAIEAFQRALARKPDSGRAWAGLGLSEMLNLNLPAANAHLAKAAEHMPTHVGSWHALAWNQIFTNDIAGAKASFQKAMDLDHNFSESHGGLAVIAVMEGRQQDAELGIKTALKLDPECYSALYAKSLILSKSGQGKHAGKLIENALTSVNAPGGGTLADMLKRVVSKQNKH